MPNIALHRLQWLCGCGEGSAGALWGSVGTLWGLSHLWDGGKDSRVLPESWQFSFTGHWVKAAQIGKIHNWEYLFGRPNIGFKGLPKSGLFFPSWGGRHKSLLFKSLSSPLPFCVCWCVCVSLLSVREHYLTLPLIHMLLVSSTTFILSERC